MEGEVIEDAMHPGWKQMETGIWEGYVYFKSFLRKSLRSLQSKETLQRQTSLGE